MKNCTDLKQSKKLMEFLPFESADMYYTPPLIKGYTDYIPHLKRKLLIDWDIEQKTPCWSLTALMDVLDRCALFKTPKGWSCQSYTEYEAITSDYYNNPIDACVAMILKLHELKLL